MFDQMASQYLSFLLVFTMMRDSFNAGLISLVEYRKFLERNVPDACKCMGLPNILTMFDATKRPEQPVAEPEPDEENSDEQPASDDNVQE